MASACALAMFSGKIVFIFGIAERLRTLRYPIFTGGIQGEKKPRGAGCSSGWGAVLRGCAYSLTMKKIRV